MCSVESARKAETEKEEDSGFVAVVEVEEGGLVEAGFFLGGEVGEEGSESEEEERGRGGGGEEGGRGGGRGG